MLSGGFGRANQWMSRRFPVWQLALLPTARGFQCQFCIGVQNIRNVGSDRFFDWEICYDGQLQAILCLFLQRNDAREMYGATVKSGQRYGKRRKNGKQSALIAAVDLFCGVGGLTRGMLDAGIPVVGGFDIDPACCFPYEFNNGGSKFHQKSVVDLSGEELAACYPAHHTRVLVGCAPCQPFSKYTQGAPVQDNDKWGLLHEFGRLVQQVKPDVISMENVPELQRHSVFFEFVASLKQAGYHVAYQEAFCPDYGIAQQRKRLVLLASLLGEIRLVPAKRATSEATTTTVRDAIAHLPKLGAGEVHTGDMMHRACKLSQLNFKRVQASRPGGTWRDWPTELVAKCHQAKSGATYPSVYGRMEWDKPAPTITTQFFGFGNGRFGHPEQDRAISLREGAILQSFPADYVFVAENQPISFATLGRLIGNAVPVKLGEAIGYSIRQHIQSCLSEGGDE